MDSSTANFLDLISLNSVETRQVMCHLGWHQLIRQVLALQRQMVPFRMGCSWTHSFKPQELQKVAMGEYTAVHYNLIGSNLRATYIALYFQTLHRHLLLHVAPFQVPPSSERLSQILPYSVIKMFPLSCYLVCESLICYDAYVFHTTDQYFREWLGCTKAQCSTRYAHRSFWMHRWRSNVCRDSIWAVQRPNAENVSTPPFDQDTCTLLAFVDAIRSTRTLSKDSLY